MTLYLHISQMESEVEQLEASILAASIMHWTNIIFAASVCSWLLCSLTMEFGN